jgi:hypothetical protein
VQQAFRSVRDRLEDQIRDLLARVEAEMEPEPKPSAAMAPGVTKRTARP